MGVRGTSGGAGGTNPNSPFLLSGTNIIYDPIAAAVVQLILGAAANDLAPVNQTLTVTNATPGSALNTAGATLTIQSGNGTGTGTPSTIAFQTPAAVGAGTGAQTMALRASIVATGVQVPEFFWFGCTSGGNPGALRMFNGGVTLTNGMGGTNNYVFMENAGGGGAIGVEIASGGLFSWANSATDATATKDLILSRRGAANLQLGNADAASPVAQTITTQGSRAGTDNNISGASLTIQAGRGTGNSAVSTIMFQAPLAVGSGTGAQTQTTYLTIGSGGVTVNAGQLAILVGGNASAPALIIGQAIGSASQEGLFASSNGMSVAIQGSAAVQWNGAASLLHMQLVGYKLAFGAVAGTPDCWFQRSAAAVFQFGDSDSATPIGQTLQVQGSRGGTDNDVGGGNLTIQSGAGTGIGAISSIVFKTPTLGTTGTTQQVQTTRMTIDQNRVVLGNRLNMAKGADVAAANDLTLGVDGNVFVITGNTQINAITTANWAAGSVIILIFSGTPTVKNNTAGGGGTAKIFLALSADLVAAANTVLQLVYDGTQWQEVSRKVA